jgi:CHAT domain-containing protein
MILLATLRLNAAPVQSPRAVVASFYDAWAKSDAHGVLSLWQRDAPGREAFRRRIEPLFRARCFTLKRLTLSGSGTRIEAEAFLGKTSRTHPDGESLYVQHAIFDLARGRGGWRIARWQLREELAADAVAASSDARIAPELISSTLTRALCARAVLRINLGDFAAAARLAGVARDLATDLDDTAGLSLVRGTDSILLRRKGDLAGSLLAVNDSLELAERAHDPDALARALLRAARLVRSDDFVDDRRRVILERALALRDDVEELPAIALVSSQLAAYYDDRGNHLAARRYADMTLQIAEESGDDIAIISAELNVGGNYYVQNDCELAVPHFERVMALARRIHYGEGVVTAIQHLVNCYSAQRRPADFFRVTRYALAHYDHVRYADAIAYLLMQRAGEYTRRDPARAARDAIAAIAVARNAPDREMPAKGWLVLASVRLAQKRWADVLRALDHAASVSGAPAFKRVKAIALWRLGRKSEAYTLIMDAVRQIDDARLYVGGDERQQQLLYEALSSPYPEFVAMLVAGRRNADALAVAERSKSRLLLDLLRGGRRIAEEQVSADDHREEHELEHRVVELQRRAAASAPAGDELRRARVAVDSFRSTLYARYPRLRVVRESAPVASLREMAAALPDDRTAFVEYVEAPHDVVAFVVRKHSLRVHHLSVAPAALDRLAGRFQLLLAQRSLGYATDARRLYDSLLAPLARDLAGVDTLCIVPDASLWRLPFEALIDPGGRFVAERFACVYAPSITAFLEMNRSERAAPRHGRFVALADPPSSLPPLADARREVAGIGALFPRSALFDGTRAVSAHLDSEARDADVIHLATHGVIDDENPMYSRVILADGPFTASQMMRLRLHARLAVLSACSTEHGRYHGGEGLIGISWALFAGGCTSTLVSDWNVASAPTADLMLAFYREWRRAPARPFAKARALQRAKLQLMHDRRTRHPMYWAAFVLIGADS